MKYKELLEIKLEAFEAALCSAKLQEAESIEQASAFDSSDAFFFFKDRGDNSYFELLKILNDRSTVARYAVSDLTIKVLALKEEIDLLGWGEL